MSKEPKTDDVMQIDPLRDVFNALSAEVGRQLAEAGVTEEEVLQDFKAWRKERRDRRSQAVAVIGEDTASPEIR